MQGIVICREITAVLKIALDNVEPVCYVTRITSFLALPRSLWCLQYSQALFRIVQTSRPWGQRICSKFAKIPHMGLARTFKVPTSSRGPPLGHNIDRCIISVLSYFHLLQYNIRVCK